MDSCQYIQTLRLRLLDMARICQRGVDYSVKAYRLASSECCFKVQDDAYEVDILNREILEYSRDVMLMEISDEPALRFVLSADRIGNALKRIHAHAADVAGNSVLLFESRTTIRCKELISMGEVVNGLARLCTVALFEEEIEHAEIVLQRDGVAREFQRRFFDWFKSLDRNDSTQRGYEIALAKSLSQIARELREVASAIVFWLENSECNWGHVQKRTTDALLGEREGVESWEESRQIWSAIGGGGWDERRGEITPGIALSAARSRRISIMEYPANSRVYLEED